MYMAPLEKTVGCFSAKVRSSQHAREWVHHGLFYAETDLSTTFILGEARYLRLFNVVGTCFVGSPAAVVLDYAAHCCSAIMIGTIAPVACRYHASF